MSGSKQKKSAGGNKKKEQGSSSSSWSVSASNGDSTDQRFSMAKRDPRFMRPKKSDTKLVIDKRFNAVFESKEFASAPRDRYGRVSKSANGSDLKKYYKLDKEDEEEGGSESDHEKEASDDDDEKALAKPEAASGAEEDDDEVDTAGPSGYDLIRGEGLIESSEEDDSENEDERTLHEEEEEESEAEEDVPTGPETSRFAAVNLDWDQLKALDLLKVFDGFKPKGGHIKSVAIYKSEFGKERLEKEEREGPPAEIFKSNPNVDRPLIETDDGEDFDEEALRKYQLERLRYYYCVVECSSIATAKAIYDACDGIEFEKSANTFDLRYIPEDMVFEDEPVDVAEQLPATYTPADFATPALQHSKVKLTWDQDDPDRFKVTRRKFTKDDLKEMDFKAYLASDSDSDAEERANRYRSLLADGGSDDEAGSDKESEAGDMEITFTPGLSEAVAEQLSKKKEKEAQLNETVFEAQQRKRKEKRKEKRLAKKNAQENDEEDASGMGSSDGFDSEDDEEARFALHDKAAARKMKEKGKKKLTKEEKAQAEKAKQQEKAELELLMLDENSANARHFDMKDVLKAEKLKNKKKKKKGQAVEMPQQDFEIDVADPRFSQVLTSHHYAIDPTNPNFKKTSSMGKLLELRRDTSKKDIERVKEKPPVEENSKHELKSLVDAVKRKSAVSAMHSDGKRRKVA
ncbi:pre-rRNA-processing protein esf1 [Chytridiales sp. JEL 0842]|nr:pre-rRNA-processing protein esf1 [Chytridiales sp. JEL 0842]